MIDLQKLADALFFVSLDPAHRQIIVYYRDYYINIMYYFTHHYFYSIYYIVASVGK